VPANPRAWLVSTGRFKAVDALRRRGRFNLVENPDDRSDPASEDVPDPDSVEDDRLRLIFTGCHPALSPENKVALTLRQVCRLTAEEIACAFLIAAPVLAQR
jgi:RNA polymerase sigma-70 factor (ECF subfamily)